MAAFTRAPSLTPTLRLDERAGASAAPSESAAARASATSTPTPLPTADPLACLPDEPGQTALVSWVSDGATFVVDLAGRRETVRLLGIDALPLTAGITRGLLDKRVVRLVADGPDRDAQGRLLRYVLLLDGRFINDELLRSGAARFDSKMGNLACRAQFERAEKYAIQEVLGIWELAARAALPSLTATIVTQAPVQPTATAPVTASATPAPTLTATGQATTAVTPEANPTPPQFQPTNTFPPTLTPPPTATQPVATGTVVGTGVQIVHIFYDGLQDPNEPDEYIEIKNFENTPVDLTDWWIYAEINSQFFPFTEFSLGPGQSCRIYTNLIEADSCVSDSFLSIFEVWENSGDCGYLFDAENEERSVFCYGETP
jgi:endonuclease YncB( thermonuclease family)